MAMLTGSCLSFAVFSNRIISPPVTTAADHWSLYQGLRVMTCRMRPFGGLAEKDFVPFVLAARHDENRQSLASDTD